MEDSLATCIKIQAVYTIWPRNQYVSSENNQMRVLK